MKNKSRVQFFQIGTVLGFGTAVNLFMLQQEWLGLEKYIVYLQSNWLDWHPAVTMSLMVVYIVYYFTFRTLAQKEDGTPGR